MAVEMFSQDVGEIVRKGNIMLESFYLESPMFGRQQVNTCSCVGLSGLVASKLGLHREVLSLGVTEPGGTHRRGSTYFNRISGGKTP